LRRHLTPLTRRASDHLPIFADVVADPDGATMVPAGREMNADAVPVGTSP
jgi:hypothetical protein